MLGSFGAAMSVLLTVGQVGYPENTSVPPVAVSEFGSFDGTGFGGELYPYDTHYPWVHGYFQEIPAYGGYVGFRPYNYKHVLSQSQAAGGWGLNPTRPYSQQFWHRYEQRASLRQDHTQSHYEGMPHAPVAPVAPVGYQAIPAPAHHQGVPMSPPVPSYPQLFQRR